MYETLEEIQRENEKLRAEINQLELRKRRSGLTATSRLEDDSRHSSNMSSDRQCFNFNVENYVAKMQRKGFDFKGRTYEQLLESLSNR